MAESLDPLLLLQEDLKDDDYEQAMASIKRVGTIALALGPARTRNELLPFLQEFCEGDNDEGQTAIADQLGDFVELVGGIAHGACLLPLLETLCGEEECVVRNAAVASLNKLCPKLAKADVAGKFLPVIRRLANGDWFTTRVSACGLVVCTYPLVGASQQTELRELFTAMCNDDTPMVRKAAFTNMGSYAMVVEKSLFKADILPIIKTQIAEDDSDTMRTFAIDCCVVLANKLDLDEYLLIMMPIVEGLQDDISWRVRKALSEKLPAIAKSVGDSAAGKRLLPLFSKLLKDKEPEVRSAACGALGDMSQFAPSGLNEHIVPLLEGLAADPVNNVRVAFSKHVLGMTIPLGKETAAKVLAPLLQQLVKDENHVVRYNVIENMDDIAEALGSSNVVAMLLPPVLELAKDPKWRVRQNIIGKSALLARHLGVKVFEKKFQSVIISALSDHVYSIREKCCEQVGEIVSQFGGKWATEKLFPSAFAIYDKTTNYLNRMTCLLMVQKSAPQCPKDIVEKSLLPIVLNACVDDVANVRLAAAATIGMLVSRVDKATVASKIKPALQKLAKDTDDDVLYFAGQSMKQLDE